MTPEEATTKRCCGPVGSGREIKDGSGTGWRRVCIGPECMGWRLDLDSPDVAVFRTPDGTRIWLTTLSGTQEAEAAGYIREGHCGLAGKDGAP